MSTLLYGSRAIDEDRPLLPHDPDEGLTDAERDLRSLMASLEEAEREEEDDDHTNK